LDNSPLASFAIWLPEQALNESDQNELSAFEKKQKIIDFFKPQFDRLVAAYDFETLVRGYGWPICKQARGAIQASINSQLTLRPK